MMFFKDQEVVRFPDPPSMDQPSLPILFLERRFWHFSLGTIFGTFQRVISGGEKDLSVTSKRHKTGNQEYCKNVPLPSTNSYQTTKQALIAHLQFTINS